MEFSNIPTCALFRHGTVIVRLKMEVSCGCEKNLSSIDNNNCKAVRKLSKCKKAVRTRTERCSDCDSVVSSSRPYRSSAARSRYVNVCAAVCLLLLVGDLSPQSSAAPARTMDRYKRTAEDQLWGNPCDLDGPQLLSVQYSHNLATNVAKQASNALDSAASFKEDFAQKLHSMTFDQLISQWKGYPWMHNWSTLKEDWFRREIIPPGIQEYGVKLTNEEIDKLVNNIDELLPAMYKGLKMVVASLFNVSKELPHNGFNDDDLEGKLANTAHKARSVLCEFNELMRSRQRDILMLEDSEIPEFPKDKRILDATLTYRDALAYLDFLHQVFHRMSERILE